jgi:hypothetical protein
MRIFGLGATATSLVLILTLASSALVGCSGGGSSSNGFSSNPMFVETCSLGCSGGSGGSQVSCGFVATYVNQDIAIYFSEEVDPATLTAATLNIFDLVSGAVPPGLRLIDPLNPRKIVFRPNVTFDAQGNASFGFGADRTYRVIVPGQSQGDPGPFIKSKGGKTNQSRLQCDIRTTLGVTDLVPGAPTVRVFVDQANLATPNPNDIIANQEVTETHSVSDVWRLSTIRLEFNDVMNPATLAPGGQASFITVKTDLDGDLTTTNDQVPLAGSWVVQQSTAALTTKMTFTSSSGIPSSGDPALNDQPRRVVVTVPTEVRDLAGNGVGNPFGFSFTPEFVLLPAVILPDANGENFTDTTFYDATRSGAEWGSGKLTRGYGGGSGRLGELHIGPAETLTLNTNSQVFPLASQAGYDILDNLQPGVDYFPGHPESGPVLPDPITITDGTFEFTTITIETGGKLILRGTNPARIFSRGSINMAGIIDLSGTTPAAHASDLLPGGDAGIPGAGGGAGGEGASRADTTDFSLLQTPAGALNPGGVNIDETMINVHKNGFTGIGIGGNTNLAPGSGGVANPFNLPTSSLLEPPFIQDLSLSDAGGSCKSLQVASPGGGGGYARDGGAADPRTPIPFSKTAINNLPSVTAGGGASGAIGIEPPSAPAIVRTLNYIAGFLRGGSGGGGGGLSLYETESAGFAPGFCVGSGTQLQSYLDHSGAGGGGGGGALQLVSGRTISVSGLIDASGGDGGSATAIPGSGNARTARAMPGGAGSGGAVRLQGQFVTLIGTTQTRIDVAGGVGGVSSNLNSWASPPPTPPPTVLSRGGDGGPGLVRLEASLEVLTPAGEAPLVGPTTPAIVGPNSENILSVANWGLPKRRPECFSGAISCWIKPTGNFFQIVFVHDDLLNADPTKRYGWNMDLRYDNGSGEQLIKFRGPDANLPFTPTVSQPDFEHFLGNTLNYGVPGSAGSYLAVRFQGAQSLGTPANPCNVLLTGVDAQILAGSLTPWVRHPGDLNSFNPRPNMVRYSVVFDTSLALPPNSIPSFIKGVTNLAIRAQPD